MALLLPAVVACETDKVMLTLERLFLLLDCLLTVGHRVDLYFFFSLSR